jgi:hypothetical protein
VTRRPREEPKAFLWVSLFLLLVTLALAVSASSVQGGEVLLNGGFEEGGGGQPLHWQPYQATLTWSGGPVRGGSHSAGLESTAAGTAWAQQTVPVQGGATYLLEGYALVEVSGPGSAHLRISWFASGDGTGKELARSDSNILDSPTPDFAHLSTGGIVAPSEAHSARVRLVIDATSAEPLHTFWDDISLQLEEPPPTPTPTPSPTSTPTATQTPTSTPYSLAHCHSNAHFHPHTHPHRCAYPHTHAHRGAQSHSHQHTLFHCYTYAHLHFHSRAHPSG